MLTSKRFLDPNVAATQADGYSFPYLTDYRFSDQNTRNVQGQVTGCSVKVETFLHPTLEDNPYSSQIFTGNFNLPINNPVAKVKVTKIGAGGSAIVDGIV